MRRTYKHKLIPTKGQIKVLEETLETHRRLYNMALGMRIKAYKEDGESLSWYDQKKWLTSVRPDNEWFLKCNRNSLDATLKRLELAYQAFFRRVKENKEKVARGQKSQKVGFPRFKGKVFFNSFEFVRNGNGYKAPEWEPGQKRTRVYIQNVGKVKMWMDRPMEGVVKTLEVIREEDKWYACFSCDVQKTDECIHESTKVVGIDLGLESFLSTSDGEHVDNPRFYRKGLSETRRLNRALSRKQKGGKNRKKARKALNRQYAKVRNRRMHFIHNLTSKMTSDYRLVVAEDLSVKQMLQSLKSKSGAKRFKRGMSMSISDAAWSRFIQVLKYKLEDQGGSLVLVNPAYTSQRCSECGAIVKKDLSVRQHECPECGLSLHRDVNAAKNILADGILALTGPAGANVGQSSSGSQENEPDVPREPS